MPVTDLWDNAQVAADFPSYPVKYQAIACVHFGVRYIEHINQDLGALNTTTWSFPTVAPNHSWRNLSTGFTYMGMYADETSQNAKATWTDGSYTNNMFAITAFKAAHPEAGVGGGSGEINYDLLPITKEQHHPMFWRNMIVTAPLRGSE